uniref:RUN domain-containing protein n=1 Tax=Plectus sambesii TaxID=2011161 RepID=A0A914X3X5_9BILA
MDGRTEADDIRKHAEIWRQTLLTRLLDAVKQCQAHFGQTKEIASDEDIRIICLLAQFEAVLHHGLRRDPSAFAAIRQATTKFVSWGSFDTSDDITLWSVVKNVLSAEEMDRMNRLCFVTTDSGRGRAWIRAALNERLMERYLQEILAKPDLLAECFEDWAFMRDHELAHTLPQVARGLSSIIFSITVDDPELNSANAISNETAEVLSDARKAPLPIMSVGSGNRSRPQSTSSATSGGRDKKRKPLVNVVSFDDNKAKMSDSVGQSKVVPHKQSITSRTENPLLASLINVWNGSSAKDGKREALPKTADLDDDAFTPGGSPKLDNKQKQKNGKESSEEIIDDLLWQSDDKIFRSIGSTSTMELLESDSQASSRLQDRSESRPESSLSDSRSEMDGSSSVKMDMNGEAVDHLRREIESLKISNISLADSYRAKLDVCQSENESLRAQLRSYADTVRMMQRQQEDKQHRSSTNDSKSSDDVDGQIAAYEEKLIQMASMHAELVELNDRLVRRLNRRKCHVNRLRRELASLRGPLCDEFSDDDLQGVGSHSTEK